MKSLLPVKWKQISDMLLFQRQFFFKKKTAILMIEFVLSVDSKSSNYFQKNFEGS